MVLVRNHLLCPFSDCVAHWRDDVPRIRVVIDEDRNVTLSKSKSTTAKERTRLSYLNKKWVRQARCPFCDKLIEVVIDETHNGRNVSIRKG